LADIFSWTSAQFGLAVGLLIVAVIALTRFVVVLIREIKSGYDKQIAELETERDLYRDKWIEALGAAEVGSEAAKRLVGGGRKRPGGR
jgi:NAD-dependent DNA ligase